MSELTRDRVQGLTGLLAPFNAAGLIGPADVHTANLLAELWDEPDERVRLAAALTVRALRAGSVCVEVARLDELVLDQSEDDATDTATEVEELPWPDAEEWVEAVQKSAMVTCGPQQQAKPTPLRLHDGLLYLERYWLQEQQVRTQLVERAAVLPSATPPARVSRLLDELFTGAGLAPDEPDLQRLAAAMAVLNSLTVVAGGPGTGKTTTLARVLALLCSVAERAPMIALAAPTGKAAARLEEAVRGSLEELGDPWRGRVGPLTAKTLHRLLGWIPNRTTRFRHDASNPLPHDIVVVDEMSMVSLTMMARLLEALRPDARIILVGDPDQLTSVEAGAVLADITRADIPTPPGLDRRLAELRPGGLAGTDTEANADPAPPVANPTSGQVVTLQHTWRYDGGIDALARAIRAGDTDRVEQVLRSGADELVFTEVDPTETAPDSLEGLRRRVIEAGASMHRAAVSGDVRGALRALEDHRVLCAHRRGPFGVSRWENQITQWLRTAVPGYGEENGTRAADWYAGLPLLVTANDADAGLFNGDTGVLVQTSEGLRAAFARGEAPTLFTTMQLDQVVPVHAMTVHKSQGSQFRRLSLVLPDLDSPLLTRELLYTAVTRARQQVEVIGSLEAVLQAVRRPANRASGLGRGW